jgi:PPOX class probable F420-dependent enzyme
MWAMSLMILNGAERRFLDEARRAVLGTRAPDDRPRLVPICFVLGDDDAQGRPRVYSPLDEKPKRSEDPLRLARVRDLLVLPEATLLVDRWSEDWNELAWLRLHGRGEILEPQPHERIEHADAVSRLRDVYRQYRDQDLSVRPIIRITITASLSWQARDGGRIGGDP